jgi:ribose transport system substrate-binding protein
MPRIAIFTKNRTNPAYDAARLGADRVAARLGATTTHYVPDEPDSVPEQIALIARAVADRPDAAVFVPVHETACNDAILRFDAAGIPLFNIITRTTAGRRVTFVGSDDRALARNIAHYLFAKLSGRGAIVIVEGTPASATSHARLKGFQDALAEHPGIAVRASLPGEYQRDVAREVFIGARDRWPGVDAVLCANDAMALGVLDALDAQAGRERRPLVVGVNAIPEAVAAIAAGRMLATANFDAMAMSALATEAAVRHLRGEAIPAEIMLPVEVIDIGIAAWNRPFAARPSRTGMTWCERNPLPGDGLDFDQLARRISPSADSFRLASPCSNCPPTILSQLMNVPMSLAIYGCGPCMAQVTFVDSLSGCKVNSTMLCALNGRSMSSFMTILDGGAESVISMRPAPTSRLPSHW